MLDQQSIRIEIYYIFLQANTSLLAWKIAVENPAAASHFEPPATKRRSSCHLRVTTLHAVMSFVDYLAHILSVLLGKCRCSACTSHFLALLRFTLPVTVTWASAARATVHKVHSGISWQLRGADATHKRYHVNNRWCHSNFLFLSFSRSQKLYRHYE